MRVVRAIRVAVGLLLIAVSWVPLIVSILIGRLAYWVGGDPFKAEDEPE